jgi:hypothetical protein
MGDKSKQKKEVKKAPLKSAAEKKKDKQAKKASRPVTSSEA